MTKDIFIKTPEQKILSLFALNPDQSFYGREISKKTKISLGATHNALMFLEENGILDSQKIGKTIIYKLVFPNSIFNVFKLLNALLVLEPLVQKLKPVSKRVILYGSYSTGTFSAESDVDLFVVAEAKEEALKIIENFERKNALDVRPIIKNQTEWMELEKTCPEFFSELSRGITIWEKPIDESSF